MGSNDLVRLSRTWLLKDLFKIYPYKQVPGQLSNMSIKLELRKSPVEPSLG